VDFVPQKPVAWLSPSQLAQTGIRVALNSVQGSFLDKRELQSAFPDQVHREVGPDGELWLDYVADTGDGFDATYTIAHLVAQPELEVEGHRLPRGGMLLLGGDEVYPTPSPDAYENKFLGPFKTAFPKAEGDAPSMYAIPGNHDWYDGLTSFLRIFTGTRRTDIGGWKIPQSRSYFAVELPGDWWLFAIDDQASTYIDDPQLAYFRRVAQRLTPQSKVILAPPSPTWVEVVDISGIYASVDYLVDRVITPTGAQVRVLVSGDNHHYARYTGSTRELITCGGGGAFLFATHTQPDTIQVPPPEMVSGDPRQTYELTKTYPSKRRSRQLSAGIFANLPRRNPGFVALMGGAHLLLMLIASAAVFSGFDSAVQRIAVVPLVIYVVAMVAAWNAFAHMDLLKSGRPRATLAGITHAVAHLALGAAGTWAWHALPLHDWPWPLSLLAAVVIYGTVSGFAAAEVVALYLFVAGGLGVNVEELFSAQGITGYKSFLRMHFAADGTLTIYPLGVARAGHTWRPEGETLVPSRPLRVHLIEPPITVSGTGIEVD
jgi:hypothetical protein